MSYFRVRENFSDFRRNTRRSRDEIEHLLPITSNLCAPERNGVTLTLKIRYQLAHCETEDEVLEDLAQKSEGHAEHAEQEIRDSLKSTPKVALPLITPISIHEKQSYPEFGRRNEKQSRLYSWGIERDSNAK